MNLYYIQNPVPASAGKENHLLQRLNKLKLFLHKCQMLFSFFFSMFIIQKFSQREYSIRSYYFYFLSSQNQFYC